MTDDTLQKAIEQNHHNLKRVLEAVEADYKMELDPEEKAERVGFFTGNAAETEDVEMTEAERMAWMFEQNAKAITAIAEAVGVSERTLVESDLTAAPEKHSGAFVPESARRRQRQKTQARDPEDDTF
jgi:hypothetical protein